MTSVVFILGAGASKDAGAPLMANFLDVASDLLRTNQVGSKSDFERVFRTIGGLQVVHSKSQLDLNNIESIFTALELGRIIQRLPGADVSDISNAIASLKEVIVETLQATVLFPVANGSISAPEPYDAFADLVAHLTATASPAQTVSVITFNYDIAVDSALYFAGLGPNYVIGNAARGGREIELLKLHGSLNWATHSQDKRILPVQLGSYFQHYSPLAHLESDKVVLRIGTQLREFFTRYPGQTVEVDAEPVIVPPSWNKADYHQALSDVWAAAADHLAEAEYIFILGYSLPETDSFFRHLFALGSVGKLPLRRIVVFNPDATVDHRFLDLLGPGARARYKFHPYTFKEAIRSLRADFPSVSGSRSRH